MHLIMIRNDSQSYPSSNTYPFNIPALRETVELRFKKPIVFFVGENGTGKSTLLEAITRKCGIHIWEKPRRHIAHNNPYETCLSDYISVKWANGSVPGSLFRAETFRNFADFLDDVALCDPGRLKYHGGHLLNTLSHGEAILTYFSGRYHIKGLYLLDEPETALSPTSQVRFLKILRQLEEAGHTQFIMATHSPLLLSYPGAQIFNFDSPSIQEIDYEQTEHYRLYKQFFTDRESLLGLEASQALEEGRVL
jgi:predicted ATPase